METKGRKLTTKRLKKNESEGIKGYHGFQAQTDVRYLT